MNTENSLQRDRSAWTTTRVLFAVIALVAAAVSLVGSGASTSWAQTGTVSGQLSNKADGSNTVNGVGTALNRMDYSGLAASAAHTVTSQWTDGNGLPVGAPISGTFTSGAGGSGIWNQDLAVPTQTGESCRSLYVNVRVTTAAGVTVAEGGGWSSIDACPASLEQQLTSKLDGSITVYRSGTAVSRLEYAGLVPSAGYTVRTQWLDDYGRPVGAPISGAFTAEASGTGVWNKDLPVPPQTGVDCVNLYTEVQVLDAAGEVVASYRYWGSRVEVCPAPIQSELSDKADGDSTIEGVGTALHRMTYEGLAPSAEFTVQTQWADGNGRPVGTPVSGPYTSGADGTGVWVQDVPVPVQTGEDCVSLYPEIRVLDAAGEVVASSTYYWQNGVRVCPANVEQEVTNSLDGSQTVDPGGTTTDRITYSGLEGGATYTVVGQWHRTDGFAEPEGAPVVTTFTADASGSGVWTRNVAIPAGTDGMVLYLKDTVYRGADTTAPQVGGPTEQTWQNTIFVTGEQPEPDAPVTTTVPVTSMTTVPSTTRPVTTVTTVVPVVETSVATVVTEVPTTVNETVTLTTEVPVTVTSTNVVAVENTATVTSTQLVTQTVPTTLVSTIPSTVMVPTTYSTTLTTTALSTRVNTSTVNTTTTSVHTSTVRVTPTDAAGEPVPAPGGSVSGSAGGAGLGALLASLVIGGGMIGAAAFVLPNYVHNGMLLIPGLPAIPWPWA